MHHHILYILLRRQSDHDFALLRSFQKPSHNTINFYNLTHLDTDTYNKKNGKKEKRLRIRSCCK